MKTHSKTIGKYTLGEIAGTLLLLANTACTQICGTCPDKCAQQTKSACGNAPQVMKKLEIGMQAPAVTLKAKTENGIESVPVTRSVGTRRTVLLFVPFAFSGTCSTEVCTLSDTLHVYDSLNADVIVVSVDQPFAQEAWKRKEGFSLTLLSDFNREAMRAYGVEDKRFRPGVLDFCGVAKRSAFIIGIDGKIKYAWVSDDPAIMPPFDEIRQTLQAGAE